jgi:hypothetical protein
VNRGGPALPPRNFRLDPGAARQVLSAAGYLRLVGFDTAGRPGCEITAVTPVFRELAGTAGAPVPPWAGPLASRCRQFLAPDHPAVLPAGPLVLSAAPRFGRRLLGSGRVVPGAELEPDGRPGAVLNASPACRQLIDQEQAVAMGGVPVTAHLGPARRGSAVDDPHQ